MCDDLESLILSSLDGADDELTPYLTCRLYDTNEYGSYTSLHQDLAASMGMECEIGATRLVLLSDQVPGWVFKVPFITEAALVFERDHEPTTDELMEAFEDGADERPNRGASNRGLVDCDDRDYCSEEVALFDAADDLVRGCLFEVRLLTTWHEMPIYVSPRARGNVWDEDVRVSHASEMEASKFPMTFGRQTRQVMIEQHGRKAFRHLAEFVSRWHVNDLHDGNLMYDRDGILKVSDYAGIH